MAVDAISNITSMFKAKKEMEKEVRNGDMSVVNSVKSEPGKGTGSWREGERMFLHLFILEILESVSMMKEFVQ